MVTTPTRDEVETRYSGAPLRNGDLTDQQADDLIDDAVAMADNVFSDRINYTNELRNENKAVIQLACHKWALALGDTVQSESQAGANASYVVSSGTARSLSRTNYGQEFLEYLESEPNVSIFRT